LIAWDEDAARGEAAWRDAPPLNDPAPVAAGRGDRVLLAASGSRLPLLFVRHIGRGQVLLLNGGGIWRWSLSGTDELAPERGRRLWRTLARWLAEPVQGEPLRVRPERWVSASGEPVRLFATLQDSAFRPTGGAQGWARGLQARALARVPTKSVRLWESPWVFALAVAALSIEWTWRRRRGLP
jgi:hypothetical protein